MTMEKYRVEKKAVYYVMAPSADDAIDLVNIQMRAEFEKGYLPEAMPNKVELAGDDAPCFNCPEDDEERN